MFEQDALRSIRCTQGVHPCSVADPRQLAFVCVQRMRLWVRCQYDGLLHTGLPQSGAAGLHKVKISRAVVDQIDGPITAPKCSAAPLDGVWTGGGRSNAVSLEKSLEQQELGAELLFFRRDIDDGDRRQ